MAKVFVMHDLRPGISTKDYEDFVARVYAPTMKAFPTVCGFSMHRLLGAPPGCAPFAYMVSLEVTNLDQYEADMQTSRYQSLMKDWSSWVTNQTMFVGEAVA
jgi:hypothetical protein